MPPVVALRFERGALWALDQTRLPWSESELELRDAEAVAAAIRRLAIRGAPLIGVAAGYGVALGLARNPADLDRVCELLLAARPTAVNLAHAVARVRAAALRTGEDPGAAALRCARALHTEEIRASDALAGFGADWLQARAIRRLLTHCNTGALAAPGRGTALAVVAELHARGGLDGVLAAESRPLLQGARLTVWELARLGIAHELIVDGAAAGLIARGEVQAVIVGCDRVAANGDVANKVGTYSHALAAAAAGIPFAVVGPTTTIDPACPDGASVEIEQRDGSEVTAPVLDGRRAEITVAGTRSRNPAFDVTPAALVSALITERGIVHPARGESVLTLLGPAPRPA